MARRPTRKQSANQAQATHTRSDQIGQRLAANFGPGRLNPMARVEAIKSGEPVFCGSIIGRVAGFREHPNSRDAAKISTVFIGDFIAIDAVGNQLRAVECYLPSMVERSVKTMVRPDGSGDTVDFAHDIWAEPDEHTGRTTAQGFMYQVYDRQRRQHDPVEAMAAAAGIINRQVIALPSDSGGGARVDPETGEVLTGGKPGQQEPAVDDQVD